MTYQPDPASDEVNERLGRVEGPTRAAMAALLVNLWASLRLNGTADHVEAESSQHDLMLDLLGADKVAQWNRWSADGSLPSLEFRPPTSELTVAQEAQLLNAMRDADVPTFCAAFRQTCGEIELGAGQAHTVCVSGNAEESYLQFIADFRNLEYDMSILGCLDGVSAGSIWYSAPAAAALQRLGLVPNANYDDPTGYRMFDMPIPRQRSIIEVHGDGPPLYTPPSQLPPTRNVPPEDLSIADQRSVWWLANLLETAGVAADGPVLFQC